MTFGKAICFQFQKLWFPSRRFLRAVKRCVMYLKDWLPVLAVFTPIAIGALFVLWKANLISHSSAIVELVLLFLGSFMLLAIREIREKEIKRHQSLLRQWEICSELRGRFGRDFEIIGSPFKAQFTKWESMANLNALNEALSTVRAPASITEKEINCIKDAIDDLKHSIQLIKDERRQIGFVDCFIASGDSYFLSNAESEALELLNNLSARNYEKAAQSLREMSSSCFWILKDFRTPWKYRMDIARRELMEKYLMQHGVEYQI